jgi:DNA-binding Lrp family transcriptional regulator
MAILQLAGRPSNAKIARGVGVTEGTVRRRLSGLPKDDFIEIRAGPTWRS